MYTKYKYIYMSMIEILYSYMSVYTNLPKYVLFRYCKMLSILVVMKEPV